MSDSIGCAALLSMEIQCVSYTVSGKRRIRGGGGDYVYGQKIKSGIDNIVTHFLRCSKPSSSA